MKLRVWISCHIVIQSECLSITSLSEFVVRAGHSMRLHDGCYVIVDTLLNGALYYNCCLVL